MQTKRIFASFAFTMLTVLLLLIVASRSGEADAGAADIDANLGPGMPAPTERAELPGSKEDNETTLGEKPDIDITSWEYMLAGPDNNIGKYTPSRVVSIEGTAQYFDERAITPLINFLNGAREAGYTTYIMTAYRSYATQEYLLNGRASQIAWPDYPTAADYAEAELYVAPPGESDHQTGLAVDIADRYYGTMDASQMDQGLLTWLREHCAEYGFILRYPSAKSSITGRDEPWHFRYVGEEAARYIMDNNLCLEQFRALYE